MKTPGSRKITFVNQYVNHLFVDIINVFATNGYSVTLITGGIYSDKPDKRVKVIKLNTYKRNGFLNRISSWKLFTFLAFCVLPFTGGKLVVSSNPPFLFPLLSVFRWTFNREIYPVVYDLYPDALIKFGYFNEKALLIRIWKRLNTKLFQKASAAFTISPGLTEAVRMYSEDGDMCDVIEIPVWGDDRYIKPVEKHKNPFIARHGLTGHFVVLYSGNFGLTHDVETILEAALLLKSEQNIKFLIIGEGAKQRLIDNFIAENSLINVILLPWQPVEELSFSLSSADIALITLSKNAEAVSLPSKTFSYLKAGVAILALSEKTSDLASLVSEHKVGVVCDSNGESLAREIIQLKENREVVKKYAENALKASENFSSGNAGKFYEVISRSS